jgi:hypothetical protein
MTMTRYSFGSFAYQSEHLDHIYLLMHKADSSDA